MKHRIVITMLVAGVLLAHGTSGSEMPEALPLSVHADTWRPLYDRVDPDLQARLEAALNQDKKRQSLIARKKLPVGLVDLADPG